MSKNGYIRHKVFIFVGKSAADYLGTPDAPKETDVLALSAYTNGRNDNERLTVFAVNKQTVKSTWHK